MPRVFKPGRALLPKEGFEKWSCIACDQYTSEPGYWEEVERLVGDSPSAYRISLPEIYLEDGGVGDRIKNIKAGMDSYLKNGVFAAPVEGYIYVERTLSNGKVRRGLVGVCDLEQYDFSPSSQSLIRATEGTIPERIPPRLRVRQGAALELPHVMLLLDDPEDKVFLNLSRRDKFKKLYSFPLMMSGGSIEGFLVPDECAKGIDAAICEAGRQDVFERKYGVRGKGALLFAVGDGNHSLATAKTCYEELKKTLSPEEAADHPARYALVELVNIHDPALEFEAIHRVVFDVDPEHLLRELKLADGEARGDSADGRADGQTVEFIYGGGARTGRYTFQSPTSNITVGTLQGFLDSYLARHGGRLDYIHGEAVVRELGGEKGNIGFILPPMEKGELFKTVILDGALPRKTFSMGHANDKRYYLECREIL
ncbi:MAG: DUF1015 domain-containing protein [Oscillospiraceae bacterium]|nr:DUF1015 domain-containing protein [Oscillospiraceae bacterium]